MCVTAKILTFFPLFLKRENATTQTKIRAEKKKKQSRAAMLGSSVRGSSSRWDMLCLGAAVAVASYAFINILPVEMNRTMWNLCNACLSLSLCTDIPAVRCSV